MAENITTPASAPKAVKYRIKGGDTLIIPGCPVKITNANLNTETIQTILTNLQRNTGRDYFKLCLERV